MTMLGTYQGSNFFSNELFIIAEPNQLDDIPFKMVTNHAKYMRMTTRRCLWCFPVLKDKKHNLVSPEYPRYPFIRSRS